MKIAVYTICKNEETFLKKWLESAKEADILLITDTGSTDNTLDSLVVLGTNLGLQDKLIVNQVTINPWRFDDARNFSLWSLPSDIDVCICLDMDEVLTKDWRQKVEAAFALGNCDRLRYNYVWSWNADGTPGVTYYADKIHVRHGFRWVNPVHEVAVFDARKGPERQIYLEETLIEHYPDTSKSRKSYLDLLALAVKENPMNDRNAHYYARDLLFAERYQEAIVEFKRHLQLPTALWKSERAASMRYLGDCYWALNDRSQAMHWFMSACEEVPGEREPKVSLAQAYRAMGEWSKVVEMCEAALSITDKVHSYINQPWAWSSWPQQMLDEAKTKLQQGVLNYGT